MSIFHSLWQRNIENGVRTSKLTAYSSYKYILNSSQIAAEMWDDCINIYLYDEYGSLIGFLHRYEVMAEDTYFTYFFEKNMFGDILAVYDQNGVKQVSYSYDAFGKSTRTIHVANTRADNNNLRYRGYYYDFETGFYYLNSRYYDPVTCRFINADGYVSTGQGLVGYNMFAYCGNNPVMYVDPTGESATVVAWKFIEVVILVVLVCVVVKTLVENPPQLPEISLPQWKSKTETEEKVEEKEKTVEVPLPNNEVVFYGADTRGGEWKKVTGPMSYEEAKIWVFTSSTTGTYGKNSSWGLYTNNSTDASRMA